MSDRLWERCAEFHGHECGGLTLGYKAALFILEYLGLPRNADGALSEPNRLICVAENNACSVDAIRVILGCTEQNGNLLFHLTGEQAYTCFDRHTRSAVRVVLKDRPEGLTREQSFGYYQSKEPKELFSAEPAACDMPQSALTAETYVCAECGETGSADWFKVVDGKILCLDCIAEQSE